MPSVVSRWHGLPSQNFLPDRKIAFETALGALSPNRSASIAPQVVVSASFQVLPPASATSGAAENFCGVAGALTVGAGHGFGPAAAEADGDSDASAEEDADGEAEADGEVVAAATGAWSSFDRFTIRTVP